MTREPFTDIERDEIRRVYEIGFTRSDGRLDELAIRLGRPKTSICRQARRMKLTNGARSVGDRLRDVIAERAVERIAAQGHPRGALGLKHTAVTRAELSKKSKAAWASRTPDEVNDWVFQQLRSRRRNGSMAPIRAGASWKAGWATIGGQRYHFRSLWERNYARYLQWLKDRGEIESWSYEPETFWFEQIRRGTRTYTPDFRVVECSGAVIFHEVKGWMDQRSRTQLRRMAKYHPQVRVVVIDKTFYRDLKKKLARLIPEWESAPSSRRGASAAMAA